MKAVIMAGGEGTRLRPLTSNAPKPLLPLAGRPMMEHVVGLLRGHGIDDIVVTVAFMAGAIQDYFGDGSDFGVRMTYATEESPLGTAGSVRNAAGELSERFLVISGDVLTDIDLSAIIAFHEDRRALATIGLAHVENPLEFGIVITRDDGHIERFLEKPTWGQVFSDTINTGIFVLEPEIFEFIAPDRPVDFSGEVFPAVLASGRPLYGAVAEGYWEDVGTLEAYLSAHRDILDDKVQVSIPGFAIGNGVWVAEGADIHPDAELVAPVLVGDNCRIEGGVQVGPYAVLGSSVRVRREALVEHTVVHDNTYIGEGVRLGGSIVGRSCDLRTGARTEEGVVLGDHCFVGEEAVLGPGVKVYPFKTIESGAIINDSIVWESRGARSLFGRHGVTGLANVDITPELATKLAMAYGSMLKKGSTVITSRDSSRSARMLKRAMMAGLNATGINVEDLEVASVPVTRFIVRRPAVAGGLTIRLDPGDPQSVTIRFFDSDGLDLAEDAQRKIERQFGREDYRRVFPGEIGDIGFAPRALEHYATALESTVDIDAIRAAGFKVVIDYLYGSASFAMPNVLAKLGLEALAVNPFVSTAGVLGRPGMEEHATEVAELVRASRSSLGAVLDPGGERITFIDDRGHVLSDTEAKLAFLSLLAEIAPTERVALPVNAPAAATKIIEGAGMVPVPTQLSSSALMVASTAPGVGFAVDEDGGFIFPDFLPGFDGAAAFVRLLELLAHAGRPLSTVVEGLPAVHVAHDRVVTPWDQKGAVMRSLMEHSQGQQVELVDGVKILRPDGWALALPDPEEPFTNVWAEAATDLEARRVVEEYVRRIGELVR